MWCALSPSWPSLRSQFAAWLVLCILSLMLLPAECYYPPEPRVVDSKIYASASGRYRLTVDPSDIYGRGAGSYRLLVEGREAWSNSLPFTFFDAVVRDDGVCIGYAYEYGWTGYTVRDDGQRRGPGAVIFVILGPKGELRLKELVPRVRSRDLTAPPHPLVDTILLYEADDRCTFSTDTDQGQVWYQYQCSSGKRLARLNVHKTSGMDEKRSRADAAEVVAGTPLSLAQWFVADRDGTRRTEIQLLTLKGQPVWTQRIMDWSKLTTAKPDPWDSLILAATQPSSFDLWLPLEGQRVTFQVSRDPEGPGGWKVQESGRQPYQPPLPDGPWLPALPPRPLVLLGSFRLEDAAPSGAVKNALSFAFDSQGRIGLLQIGAGRQFFTLLDHDEKVLFETPLPEEVKGAKLSSFFATPVAADRWLLAASEAADEEQAWAWWFDARTGKLSEPISLLSARMKAVAGLADGGFAILASRRASSPIQNELQAFDRDGVSLWKIQQYGAEEGKLFSPEDLAVTSRGELAVLDQIRNTIQLHGAGGKYLRTIHLEKTWKRTPKYLTHLRPDLDGGFVVQDFTQTEPPFTRTLADGQARQRVRPRYRDGRPVEASRGACVAPDGRLWVCDGKALLRLNDDGVVDHSIGHEMDAAVLDDIVKATTDRHGRLYAVDRRTGAVHVYDSTGHKLRVCVPAAGDLAGDVSWPHLAVADDGSVFLRDSTFTSDNGCLQFDGNGQRVGFKSLKTDDSQMWFPQPGTENFVVTVGPFAALVDATGQRIKSVDRRADRVWMKNIYEVEFAADGSFAIRSKSQGLPVITLFGRDATPIRTFTPIQESGRLVGYNGTHVVSSRENTIEIYDVEGKLERTFTLPPAANRSWLSLAMQGRELWSFDFTSREVHRYQMP